MEDFVNKATGKGEIDKVLAFEWLKKGLGVYKLEEDDILYLQGYRYVQVKMFKEWGKSNNSDYKHGGFIDVKFKADNPEQKVKVDCCGRMCHFEFFISCTGSGGTIDPKLTKKEKEELGLLKEKENG